MQIIGHGVDLVDIARIETMLAEHGRRFVQRCFTEREQQYAEASRRHRAQRYAARFACKEAVLKALGTGWRDGIAWRDVEVVRVDGERVLVATGLSPGERVCASAAPGLVGAEVRARPIAADDSGRIAARER